MSIKEPIRELDGRHVPSSPLTPFVAADQEDGSALGVEGEQNSDRSSTQLLQVGMFRALHSVYQRPPKGGAVLLQDLDEGIEPILLDIWQPVRPIVELCAGLDLPTHDETITLKF